MSSIFFQPESDGSRSGSSLSLRNLTGPDAIPAGTNSQVQSPTHRRVHRSISATSTNPNRRASSGGETLRKIIEFVKSSCFISILEGSGQAAPTTTVANGTTTGTAVTSTTSSAAPTERTTM